MWHGQSIAVQSAAAVVLMPLCIFCCLHRSIDWLCSSVGLTTPQNCPFLLSLEGSRTRLIYMVFWAHLSHPPRWHFEPFILFRQDSRTTSNVTNRQTRWPRYSICSNMPHLAVAVMQPNNNCHNFEISIGFVIEEWIISHIIANMSSCHFSFELSVFASWATKSYLSHSMLYVAFAFVSMLLFCVLHFKLLSHLNSAICTETGVFVIAAIQYVVSALLSCNDRYQFSNHPSLKGAWSGHVNYLNLGVHRSYIWNVWS